LRDGRLDTAVKLMGDGDPMPSNELVFIVTLAAVNLAAGLGLAPSLARRLNATAPRAGKTIRGVLPLLGVYFLECVAFAAGMATQVFTIGLAVLWGVVFGRQLRARRPAHGVLGTSLFLGVYTCLPTTSFGILLLLAMWLAGADVTSTADGAALGIPHFVPWPMNTILGFSLVLSIGTLVVKTAVTVGLAGLLARPDRQLPPGAAGGAERRA
jgi:hypothetical protein